MQSMLKHWHEYRDQHEYSDASSHICHPADAAKVHLVKPIEHTTEETERLSQISATQQFHWQVRRCTSVVVCEYSHESFSFTLTYPD